VKWYLCFNSDSKTFLHENGYGGAKQLYNLNTALIQTGETKLSKSSRALKKQNRIALSLKCISIRFGKKCYNSKTTNVLTPHSLKLSLNKRERISIPIAFDERQKQRIEGAFEGQWSFTTVEMVKRSEWYAHFS